MSLIYLLLTIAILWVHLIGLGLAANLVIRDYAVARIAGLLVLCLGFFFVEHFVGLGGHFFLLPFSTVAAVGLIWWKRELLRKNWGVEAWFALGFFYCLLWRYTFPDIDMTGEKMPNLVFIEDYLMGQKLPAPDRWMPPLRADFYYGFQHYGAALMARWLGMTPGMAYHLAYCTVVGLIVMAIGGIASRLGSGRVAKVMAAAVLIVGGSGVVVIAPLILKGPPNVLDCVRFLGGTTDHGDLNERGLQVAQWLKPEGAKARDEPMEPLSYLLINGDYHPPLAGHLILAFTILLMATLESGGTEVRRKIMQGLLAATVPVILISNAWVFPMQALLVTSWFVWRMCQGEKRCWQPALVGAGMAVVLEYPFLSYFTQQTVSAYAAIKWVTEVDRTPLLGWLMIFWPVVGLLILAFWNRERRAFSLYQMVIWTLLLAFTEFFFNDDLYGGHVNRFNTCLKWWTWVYAGAILSVGISNLAAKNRFCRYGSMAILLPVCLFALPLGRQYWWEAKLHRGKMEGSGWLESDRTVKDLLTVLEARPDGIALQSGLVMANSESPGVTLFSRKMSWLGWPWHETTWRGNIPEIQDRKQQIEQFYEGKMENPLDFLLRNNIRYVLWLQGDNVENNARFRPIHEKIRSRYAWISLYGNEQDVAIGFWERIEPEDRAGIGH